MSLLHPAAMLVPIASWVMEMNVELYNQVHPQLAFRTKMAAEGKSGLICVGLLVFCFADMLTQKNFRV